MASTAFSSQGATLSIGTGSGGAKTISGVAVGNPTVITATAHGFNNGDYVAIAALTGADAALVNGISWTVQFKTTNTFAIGVDTTGKTITAGSGTATPVTFTAIKNARGNITFADGQATEIDVTNLASTAKEFIMGLQDGGSAKFEVDIDNSDAGQAALSAAQAAAALKTFKIVLPSGVTPNITFNGYVRQFSRAMGVDQVVKGQVDIRNTGGYTFS